MNGINQNPLIFGLIVLILICTLRGKIPGLGELPGDIELKGHNWHIYIPLMSAVLVSLVLSLLFRLFGKH